MLQQLLSNFVEFRHDQQFGLNLIKVLSMLLVTISHFGIIIGANDRQSMINSNMMIFMINSLYAVDLFFLVSGTMLGKKILLNQSYFTKFKEGSFLLLDRILRVYPVYWLVLSLYIILPIIYKNIGYQQNCEDIIFDMIFLVQNITNKFSCFEWSWYIAVEIQILVILLISFIMVSKIFNLFIHWKYNGKQKQIESNCIKLFSCITLSLLLISLSWSVFTCINENYKISFYSMTDKKFYYKFYQKPLYKMTSFLVGILYGIGQRNSFQFIRFFIINNPFIRKILAIMFLYYSLFAWIYIKDNNEFIPDIIQNLHQSTSRFILCIGIIYSNILNINTQNYILNYSFQILSKLLYCIYLTHYFLFQIIINNQLFDLGNILNYIISLLIVLLISAIVYQKIEKQLSEKIITKLRQKFLEVNNQRAYQKIK